MHRRLVRAAARPRQGALPVRLIQAARHGAMLQCGCCGRLWRHQGVSCMDVSVSPWRGRNPLPPPWWVRKRAIWVLGGGQVHVPVCGSRHLASCGRCYSEAASPMCFHDG